MIINAPSRMVAVLGCAWLLLSGCVGPSRTSEDYRRKAISTAEDVQGQVSLAALVVDNDRRGRSTETYSAVMLAEASEDVSSIVAAFRTVQPSSARADELRDRLLPLLEGVGEALEEARILARRGKVHEISFAELNGLADDLEMFVKAND